jgi:hypothetical protein
MSLLSDLLPKVAGTDEFKPDCMGALEIDY